MITFSKVSKTYMPKKGVPVEALKEVSFSLPDKGLFFILGRSGSGKSTALHLLGGLDSATGGDIHASIIGRKKEIGILRSLGASKKDVFLVFFGESILISIISVILAVMLFGFGTMGFNIFLNTRLLMPISLLRVGIRQIAIILALSVGVALAATFIPCYRNSCKKPIDVIKDL